jgi:hypothetical protein
MLTTMESDAELSKIAFSKKDAHFRPIHSPIVSIMERDKIEETKPKKTTKKRTQSDSVLKQKKKPTLRINLPKYPKQVEKQYYDYNLRRSPSLVIEHAAEEYRSNSAPNLSSHMKEGDISEDYGFYDHSFKGGKQKTRRRRKKSKKNKRPKRSRKTKKRKMSRKKQSTK